MDFREQLAELRNERDLVVCAIQSLERASVTFLAPA